MPNLISLLEKSDELPTLPEIYIRVSELLDDDFSSAHDIGEAVQTDPSLTTRILKLVNSAYYGLPNPVTSVAQAVSLLGRAQLKQILLGSVLAGIFSDLRIPNFSMRDFWQHSIKTAIIARHLAMQNANILDHEAFFTAGLLHDIGRLVIAKAEPDLTVHIRERARSEHRDIVDVETEVLGISHVDVGMAMMQNWSLPGVLTKCIARHHETLHEGPYAVETGIVYLANQLSKYPLPEYEEDMEGILMHIQNWEKTECTQEQIYVACQLADEQEHGVLESLGMVDMEISDDADEMLEYA